MATRTGLSEVPICAIGARKNREAGTAAAQAPAGDPAQLLHEVEELARVVALEGDDELLVVEAERVRGVDRDFGVATADLDVALHDPLSLLCRQPVPAALLDHRVEEEVLALGDADLRPCRLLAVGRALGHREE